MVPAVRATSYAQFGPTIAAGELRADAEQRFGVSPKPDRDAFGRLARGRTEHHLARRLNRVSFGNDAVLARDLIQASGETFLKFSIASAACV